VKIRILIYIILILAVLPVFSQQSTKLEKLKAQTEKASKLIKVDSSANDTVTIKKKVPLYVPHYLHGSWEMSSSAFKTITKKDFLDINYSSVSDILNKQSVVYPLSLGMYGQNHSFSIFGGGIRDVSYSYSGRTIIDGDYGVYNPEMMPPEFIEKIELFCGSDAVCFADNASGGFINFQEIRYNSAVPYTRLWYEQGGGESISADGVFSQNVAPNLNLTLGFRSMHSDGFYKNENFNSWNARFKLRYDLSNKRSISLTENYSYLFSGLNGGLKPSTGDMFNAFFANENYLTLDERSVIHDITGLYSQVSDDSTGLFSSTIYYSNIYRYKNCDEFDIEPATGANNYDAYYNRVGANIRLDKKYKGFSFVLGSEANYLSIPKSEYIEAFHNINVAEFVKLSFNFTKAASLSLGERVSYLYNKLALNFGTRFTLKTSEKSSIFADASFSQRVPTPAENLSLNKENHYLGIISFSSKSDKFGLDINAFGRYIENPITAIAILDTSSYITNFKLSNLTAIKLAGLSSEISWEIFPKLHLTIKPMIIYDFNSDKKKESFPIFSGYGEIYYQYSVVKSSAKLGISGNFVSGFNGQVYSPLQRLYYATDNNNRVIGNSINAFAILKLYTANVRIELQNILDTKYYYVPYYPQIGRNVRLSVSLPFL